MRSLHEIVSGLDGFIIERGFQKWSDSLTARFEDRDCFTYAKCAITVTFLAFAPYLIGVMLDGVVPMIFATIAVILYMLYIYRAAIRSADRVRSGMRAGFANPYREVPSLAWIRTGYLIFDSYMVVLSAQRIMSGELSLGDGLMQWSMTAGFIAGIAYLYFAACSIHAGEPEDAPVAVVAAQSR